MITRDHALELIEQLLDAAERLSRGPSHRPTREAFIAAKRSLVDAIIELTDADHTHQHGRY